MKKLYISDSAIKLKGAPYFKDDTADDYTPLAKWGELVPLNNGLFINCDDMGDISIVTGVDDDSPLSNVEDL